MFLAILYLKDGKLLPETFIICWEVVSLHIVDLLVNFFVPIAHVVFFVTIMDNIWELYFLGILFLKYGKLLLETFIICGEVASSMLLYTPPYCGCSCQLFLCPSLMWSFCEWIQLTRLDKHHIVTSGSGSLSQWMI